MAWAPQSTPRALWNPALLEQPRFHMGPGALPTAVILCHPPCAGRTVARAQSACTRASALAGGAKGVAVPRVPLVQEAAGPGLPTHGKIFFSSRVTLGVHSSVNSTTPGCRLA